MSLPNVNWKKGKRFWVAVTDNVPRRFMDALYLVMGPDTNVDPASVSDLYYDDSARVSGVGSAVGSVNKDQYVGVTEALYWSYVTGALNHRGIIAGQGTATKSPTMGVNDSFAANRIMMNCTKNAGPFTTWDAANPFGGQSFGYWHLTGVVAAPAVIGADWYECQEAMHIAIRTTGGADMGGMGGAITDPQSTLAADAESDGRNYGMITAADGFNTDWTDQVQIQSGSLERVTEHQPSNGSNHAGILTPGTSSTETLRRTQAYANLGESFGTTYGGAIVGFLAIPFRRSGDNIFRGNSRRWGPTKAVPSGAVFQSGGADVAYAGWANNIYSVAGSACAFAA
jgi:hypothetical protein